MAEMGIEPIRPYGQGILSPQRLPFRHSAGGIKVNYYCQNFKEIVKTFAF